mgnify:CR=1 FL=1
MCAVHTCYIRTFENELESVILRPDDLEIAMIKE